MLPREEEIERLRPGPGSVTWNRAADARTLLAAGYALVLQVAHPTVGAGVAEHSRFREDPWGRLLATLDFTTSLVYAPANEAAAVARNVRARHTRIRGVRPDGARYSALEPDAFAWVHATLFAAIVAGHDHFGMRLREHERAELWHEWWALGRLIGVRPGDLPEAHDAFELYFEATVGTVLEANATVTAVLDALARPSAPPLPALALPLWWAARLPAQRAMLLTTVGLLPAVLRERLGLRFGARERLELGALSAASRASTPLLPPQVRTFGPWYLRQRAEHRSRLAAGA